MQKLNVVHQVRRLPVIDPKTFLTSSPDDLKDGAQRDEFQGVDVCWEIANLRDETVTSSKLWR